MLLDPFTLVYSTGRIAKQAYRFNILDKEIDAYRSALNDAFTLASDVARTSNRLQTRVSPSTKAQIDHAVRQTMLVLENARNLINWEEVTQGGIRAAIVKTRWMLQYKPHRELVRQCRKTLVGHKRDLSDMLEERRLLDASLGEKRHAMFAALAMRISKTETRYPDVEGQGQVPRVTAIRDYV
jgi:hypothetical protein